MKVTLVKQAGKSVRLKKFRDCPKLYQPFWSLKHSSFICFAELEPVFGMTVSFHLKFLKFACFLFVCYFFLEKIHQSNWFLHFTECHFFLYIIILIPLLPPKLFFIIFSYCFEISCSLEESAPSSTCMNIKMHSVVFKPPVKTTNSWKTWTSWLAWST